MMAGQWRAMLAFAALTLCVSTATGAAVFQRPINQDCVAKSSTVSASSVSDLDYFPSDLLVVGEVFQSKDHVTVCFKRLRRAIPLGQLTAWLLNSTADC